jgi:putative two-component system response regulator
MERNHLSGESMEDSQLKKYAQDLVTLYKSERQKSKQLHSIEEQLVKYADDLDKAILELKASHGELQRAFFDTIHRLVLAAEYKDEDTGDHILRISRYSAFIAEKLGLPAKDVQNILYAAPMHDVGKIGIPESILLKPGKLTEGEFGIVKTHTIIGANILAYSKVELIRIAEHIALSHHERWNGTGYPQGLAGEDIHIAARIASIADVFDALTSKRPYKEPYPIDEALDIIKKERAEHFDPDITDVLLKHMDQMVKIKAEVGSAATKELPTKAHGERPRAPKD